MTSPQAGLDQNRQLGQGFGPNNEFYVQLSEDGKDYIELPSQDEVRSIKTWIETQREDGKLKDTLSKYIPEVLVEMDIPELARFRLPEALHPLFCNERYFDRLEPRFILSLRNICPGLSGAKLATLLKQPLSVENKQVLAYLIPALLRAMDSADRKEACYVIAQRLHPKRFECLFDPKYYKVQYNDQFWEKQNNGRTLKFMPKPFTAIFRGNAWKYDHTHFHIGKEKEYVLWAKGILEPAAEIHNIFRRTVVHDGRKYKQYMGVAVPLEVHKHNNGIESVINGDAQAASVIDFKKIFFPRSEHWGALYHSWGSLISKTPAFVDGIRFSLLLDSITVDALQFKRLKGLMGEVTPLDPSKILDPIDRRPYIIHD